MYYCYNLRNLYKEEEAYAKDLNMYLYYDEDDDVFYNKDGKEVSIYNKIIFVRSGIFHFKSLLMAVQRHSGISITPLSDIDKIYKWPTYIQTDRKVFVLKVYEILNNRLYWESLLSNNVLVKIKDVNINFEIKFEDIYDKSGDVFRVLNRYRNNIMTICNNVPCLQDERGKLEYRVFVIGGKLLNISRKNDNLDEVIDSDVVLASKAIISKFKHNFFPPNYSLDIFLSNKGVEIADCNPIEASASYAYNSVFLRNYNIYREEYKSSIPKEKLIYGDGINKQEKETFEEDIDMLNENDDIQIKTLYLKQK